MRLSIILILLGLLMTIGGFVLPFATVRYVEFKSIVPAGTEDEPTVINAGADIQLKAWIAVEPVTREVTIESVSGEPYNKTGEPAYRYWKGGYEMWYDWAVPNFENVKYKVTWEAWDGPTKHPTDYLGAAVGYAITEKAPDGYFTINGEKATEESVHVVNSPNLSFEFIATYRGEAITQVEVHIIRGEWGDPDYFIDSIDLPEYIPDKKWTGNYTLPEYGKYTIKGFYYGDDRTFQPMTTLVSYKSITDTITDEGEEGGAVTPVHKTRGISVITIAGLLTTGIGAVMYLTETRRRR